jgi:integrase
MSVLLYFGDGRGRLKRLTLADTPKNHKTRRVDVSKELRRVLLERRDAAMLKAFERGEEDLLPLVFPSETGGPLDGVNVYHRDLLPCLQAAGIRRVTFHACVIAMRRC